MSEPPSPSVETERDEVGYRPPPEAVPVVERRRRIAMLVYVLLLAGSAVWVTFPVAVVIAFVCRDDGPPWLRSHFVFQIWTFWAAAAMTALGWPTTLLLGFGSPLVFIAGLCVLLFSIVWLIVRCAKGLWALGDHRAIRDPLSPMFG